MATNELNLRQLALLLMKRDGDGPGGSFKDLNLGQAINLIKTALNRVDSDPHLKALIEMLVLDISTNDALKLINSEHQA